MTPRQKTQRVRLTKREKSNHTHTGIGTATAKAIEANPPKGERGEFVKLTCTLPPHLYELLANEAARRKMRKLPNPVISAVIRDAVVKFFLDANNLTELDES